MIGNACGGGDIIIDGYQFGVEIPALGGADFWKAVEQEEAHILALAKTINEAGVPCATGKLGIINFENYKETRMIMGLIFFGSQEQGQTVADALAGEKVYNSAGVLIAPTAPSAPKTQPKRPARGPGL